MAEEAPGLHLACTLLNLIAMIAKFYHGQRLCVDTLNNIMPPQGIAETGQANSTRKSDSIIRPMDKPVLEVILTVLLRRDYGDRTPSLILRPGRGKAVFFRAPEKLPRFVSENEGHLGNYPKKKLKAPRHVTMATLYSTHLKIYISGKSCVQNCMWIA